MFFLTRSRKRSLKHLEWRIRLFGVGALLALVGISVQMPWLVYTAIVVLVAGIGLRFLEEPMEEDGDSDSHGEESEDESEGDPGAL